MVMQGLLVAVHVNLIACSVMIAWLLVHWLRIGRLLVQRLLRRLLVYWLRVVGGWSMGIHHSVVMVVGLMPLCSANETADDTGDNTEQ